MILSSRGFIVAYKREDLRPTSSTSQKAYLGIDVAKLKLDAVLLLEEHHCHRIFANTAEGSAALHAWLQQQGASQLCVCLESTGSYSDAIVRFLLTHEYVVSLLNPAVLVSYRKTKNMRRKTDKVDAYLLALYGREEEPAAWLPRIASGKICLCLCNGHGLLLFRERGKRQV